jgi:hypothetical protein
MTSQFLVCITTANVIFKHLINGTTTENLERVQNKEKKEGNCEK